MTTTSALIEADCMDALAGIADGYVDAIVTDPPYGLGFMGRAWDALPPGVEFARECLRVLKPGGHLLAFGGTRTYHRLACALEDAGLEIRDTLAWLYASGFPKSHDVSKAIDRAAGADREVVGVRTDGVGNTAASMHKVEGFAASREQTFVVTAPATPEAERWQGWGTALKPAFEPVVLARRPLAGTVATNVLAHGTGALNVDGCRVGSDGGTRSITRGDRQGVTYAAGAFAGDFGTVVDGLGRWPANVAMDEDMAMVLDARFFYVAKASNAERDAGLDERNTHPTVKPVDLMRWLVRLVTPPGGIVLDPFAGTGTTGIAAHLEGVRFAGIERDPEYVAIATARLDFWRQMPAGTDVDAVLTRARERETLLAIGQMELLP